MKKFCYLLALALFTGLMGSCANLSNPSDKNPQVITGTDSGNTSDTEDKGNGKADAVSRSTIKDYFTIEKNSKYSYEGKGSEYASYTTWVDYIRDNRIQLRTNNGGTELVKVIENKDGELKLIFSREETYYREDLTSKQGNKDEILLKEPLIKGTSWTLPDGRKRYISNTDIEINTPSGNYKALEVTTEGSGNKNLDYYAVNVGLVKSIYTSEGLEVSSQLSKLENTPFTQSIRFYYPNINDDKLYFADEKLSFNTNDLTKQVFEKVFKEAPAKEVGKLLGPNVKLKSLYVGDDDIVYADFSKEFVPEMNAGSGYEGMILQSIVNTLGGYYGKNRVYITIEGEPYSSGHILMKKGETFTVNTKDSIELKK